MVHLQPDETTAADALGDAEIYAAHAPRLVVLAAALAGPSRADDVVSDAVLRAMASPSWPMVENRGAYLTRAVVNEVRSAHRRDLRREVRERRAAASDGAPREVGAVPDPVPEVLDALAALPLQQRAAVFLTYWADLAPSAVADHLGVSEGTVRKQLARARERLRKELR